MVSWNVLRNRLKEPLLSSKSDNTLFLLFYWCTRVSSPTLVQWRAFVIANIVPCRITTGLLSCDLVVIDLLWTRNSGIIIAVVPFFLSFSIFFSKCELFWNPKLSFKKLQFELKDCNRNSETLVGSISHFYDKQKSTGIHSSSTGNSLTPSLQHTDSPVCDLIWILNWSMAAMIICWTLMWSKLQSGEV